MKTTKGNIERYVRFQLGTNRVWALKALVRIFQENQTQSEQRMQATTDANGMGFTGTDAEFLSSLAQQYVNRGHLSEKQMLYVLKYMRKYHRQVVAMSDYAVLTKLVEAAPLSEAGLPPKPDFGVLSAAPA